jgi:hypothetical protein
MMGLGIEVEIGVSGLAVHFVSERPIWSSVNIQVQEWEVGGRPPPIPGLGYLQKRVNQARNK